MQIFFRPKNSMFSNIDLFADRWSTILKLNCLKFVFLDKNFWKFVNIIAKLIILKNWEPKHATICCLSISVSVKVKEGGYTLGN